MTVRAELHIIRIRPAEYTADVGGRRVPDSGRNRYPERIHSNYPVNRHPRAQIVYITSNMHILNG
jgi:hypothetical protein